jgi:hypothetical protein
MMLRQRGFVAGLGAGVLMLAACGPAPQPAAPAPTAAPTAVPALVVPDAALRVAERTTLTGVELGTMWTFENPPREYWRATYGFEPTQQWLDHVRLASVRYGEHCSASFVSPTGLVMTNHHCARGCIEGVSPPDRDYVIDGFHAPTRAEEPTCPELFLDQLVEIEDVTARVRTAAPAAGPVEDVARLQGAEQEAIEQECEADSELVCQVVSLFHGGQFRLYKYQRYAPVKLVWAPELQAGYFGGDPDNFTYPRYNLDVAFVRAYQADGVTPASTPQFFRFNPQGAQPGDLVFVTGNPGSTSRQVTFAQVLYEREYRHPFTIMILEAQAQYLRGIAAQGPEQEREVREDLFSIENALKAYTGQYAGLVDTLLLGQRLRWEQEFRARVAADRDLQAAYGAVWDRLAAIQAEKRQVSPRLNLANVNFLAAGHIQVAGMLARHVRQLALPEAQRMPGFAAQAAQLDQVLRSPLPLDPESDRALLVSRLLFAQRWLTEGDPLRRATFMAEETAEQAADRLLRETRVADPAYRQQVLAGGVGMLEGTTDPLLRLADLMERTYQQLHPRWQQITTEEAVQQQRLAEALFAAYGTQLPPDATFTLRISDGVVQGYPFNGTLAPPFTSIFGLYERANNFRNEMPFTLPPAFARRRAAVDMSARLNFVTTNDITGGNSGSPVIDRQARIVGIAFDSNIEALPNEFLFRTGSGRAVSVHSGGIIEALRNVYQTRALLNELLGPDTR